MEKVNFLTGYTDSGFFLECGFFAIVGVIFVLLLGTTLRDPNSPNSPNKFSGKYLLTDNHKRILASIIAIYISLRFMPDIFGVKLSYLKALGVGMSWDAIALIIKQKTSWLDPKNNKPKDDQPPTV